MSEKLNINNVRTCANCEHYKYVSDPLFEINMGQNKACFNPPKLCGEWKATNENYVCEKHRYH